MPDGQNTNGIGAAVKRREDFRFLTGQGRYTDDINRPGQTYAYILRSDQAHAKISVDTSAAAAADGAITRADHSSVIVAAARGAIRSGGGRMRSLKRASSK